MTPERMDELWEQVPSCDLARDERHWYADMIAREARREALEEAARVCEGVAPTPNVITPYGPAYTGDLAHVKDAVVRCAAAIRALADAPDAGAGG